MIKSTSSGLNGEFEFENMKLRLKEILRKGFIVTVKYLYSVFCISLYLTIQSSCISRYSPGSLIGGPGARQRELIRPSSQDQYQENINQPSLEYFHPISWHIIPEQLVKFDDPLILDFSWIHYVFLNPSNYSTGHSLSFIHLLICRI